MDFSDHGNLKEHLKVPHEHIWEYNNGKPKEIKEYKMKGCIIKNDEISIKKVFNCIKDVDKYNWLITNIECYPLDEEIAKFLDNEYCWIKGKELMRLLEKENLQWIWGVFSAFSKEVALEEVLEYNYPYADGYKGFWENPITVQHPLAITEIAAWDGLIILVISKSNEIVNTFMKENVFANDLEEYNRA